MLSKRVKTETHTQGVAEQGALRRSESQAYASQEIRVTW